MKIKEYKEEEYRTIFGVTKTTFDEMVRIVKRDYESLHKKGAERMDQLP